MYFNSIGALASGYYLLFETETAREREGKTDRRSTERLANGITRKLDRLRSRERERERQGEGGRGKGEWGREAGTDIRQSEESVRQTEKAQKPIATRVPRHIHTLSAPLREHNEPNLPTTVIRRSQCKHEIGFIQGGNLAQPAATRALNHYKVQLCTCIFCDPGGGGGGGGGGGWGG